MPGLVGGFGKYKFSYLREHKGLIIRNSVIKKDLSCILPNLQWNGVKKGSIGLNFKILKHPLFTYSFSSFCFNNLVIKRNIYSNTSIFLLTDSNFDIGPYLAGLIEGDGTIAVHNIRSISKKYNPKIIIIFKKADLPLANYLQKLINCGQVYIKPNRGYVLWQIQDLVGVYRILWIINGYMRTPKIIGMHLAIDWLNNYIIKNCNSKIASTISILNKIGKLECKPLDTSPLDSNSWFSGFTDSDGNFSINIHKRSNINNTRVQLYYRLEIKQNYHKINSYSLNGSFFPIMSEIGLFLGVTVYSRSRLIKDKIFNSYTVITHNKTSLSRITDYFNKYPLLSSKYLDYKDWKLILDLQNSNKLTSSYLDKAIIIRKDFNTTRTTFTWNHLTQSKA